MNQEVRHKRSLATNTKKSAGKAEPQPLPKPLYDSKRFKVTHTRLSTPTTFYPIAETVGRIRKDILFFALAFSAVVGFALWRYSDLWFTHEIFSMGGAIILALLIGTQLSILQIDARGFPSRMYIGRSKTIRAVFDAITEAKTESMQAYGDASQLGSADIEI